MANWDEGAIVDIAPRRRFHREVTPIWLSAACTLLGSRAPSPGEPFRYADLGCGAGLDALIVAAAYPRAEVWGFDFNPAYIEAARDLAGRAGLPNIHFVETSFAAMTEMSADAFPPFDFMVAQSVPHVVSMENREHIWRLIGRHSRPGGIVCLGYAADTGWAGFEPIQVAMRMLYEAGNDASDLAAAGILHWLQRMRSGGALFMERNPIVDRHLGELRRRPAGDLANEFLNREWHALSFADVADAMAEVKCEFVGRAMLHENIASASLSPAMLPMLDAATSIRIRETMQDIAAATRWRCDIYRRGQAFPPVAEHRERLAAITVAALDREARAGPDWLAPAEDDPPLYQPLLEALRTGPLSVARAQGLGTLVGRPIEAAADAIAMLIAGGYAHPVMPDAANEEAAAATRRLNEAIIDAIGRGEEMAHLASPVVGTGIETNPLEALTVGALLSGAGSEDLDGLVARVARAMRRSGRTMVRQGAPFADEAEAEQLLKEMIPRIIERRVPWFEALGILPRL